MSGMPINLHEEGRPELWHHCQRSKYNDDRGRCCGVFSAALKVVGWRLVAAIIATDVCLDFCYVTKTEHCLHFLKQSTEFHSRYVEPSMLRVKQSTCWAGEWWCLFISQLESLGQASPTLSKTMTSHVAFVLFTVTYVYNYHTQHIRTFVIAPIADTFQTEWAISDEKVILTVQFVNVWKEPKVHHLLLSPCYYRPNQQNTIRFVRLCWEVSVC